MKFDVVGTESEEHKHLFDTDDDIEDLGDDEDEDDDSSGEDDDDEEEEGIEGEV